MAHELRALAFSLRVSGLRIFVSHRVALAVDMRAPSSAISRRIPCESCPDGSCSAASIGAGPSTRRLIRLSSFAPDARARHPSCGGMRPMHSLDVRQSLGSLPMRRFCIQTCWMFIYGFHLARSFLVTR